MPRRWLHVQGDPSVRRFLFDQERVPSAFDAQLDEVLNRIDLLLTDHGVFHARIDFSQEVVTLWDTRDPLCCRIHTKEQFLGRALWRAYPLTPYPWPAVIPRPVVTTILAEFRRLRLQDPHVYLRSGAIHLITGMVSLTFSCDGSHYLDYQQFLRNARSLFSASSAKI